MRQSICNAIVVLITCMMLSQLKCYTGMHYEYTSQLAAKLLLNGWGESTIPPPAPPVKADELEGRGRLTPYRHTAHRGCL